MQVDPAQAPAAPSVVLQHMAQRLLAPGRVAPSIEQALRVFVLSAGRGRLQGLDAVFGDELRQPGLDLRRRRPFGRHDQVGQPVVGRVARQRLGEILEVAVQVDVLVGGAAQPREAIGVQRMDVEQCHAGARGRCMEARIGEQRVLHARAAVAFDAVAGAAEDQYRRRVGRAEAGHVHGQQFAVAAQQRVRMGHRLLAGGRGRFDELASGLGVTLREVRGGLHRTAFSAPPATSRPGAPRRWRRAGSTRR